MTTGQRTEIKAQLVNAINVDAPTFAGHAFEIEEITRDCADEISAGWDVPLAVQGGDESIEVWERDGDPKAPLVSVNVETGKAS